jgi:precorrin-2 dehydrogenase / sirohydrochlorin ferrochelatase
MVLCAVDDPEASTQVWKLCKERRIAANIADVPPECDFYFGSVHRDGPLQIMISTNGNGPKLANIIRRQIAAGLPKNVGHAIRQVGALRRKLRKVAPNIEEGPKRMKWYVYLGHMTKQLDIDTPQGCLGSANLGASRISAI